MKCDFRGKIIHNGKCIIKERGDGGELPGNRAND